jgi:hypothetical protein
MSDSKKQSECAICSKTLQRTKPLLNIHTFSENCLAHLFQTQKVKKLPISCVQFWQECQIPLCEYHLALHQKANYSLVSVEQAPKH